MRTSNSLYCPLCQPDSHTVTQFTLCAILRSPRRAPAHLAFGSFVRPLRRSTSNSSRYPVKATSQCPTYATLSLEYPDTRLERRPLSFLGLEDLVVPC